LGITWYLRRRKKEVYENLPNRKQKKLLPYPIGQGEKVLGPGENKKIDPLLQRR